MTRSDFDQQSTGLWRGSRYSHILGLQDYIKLRGEAAEAAGVTWDPEGPYFPERLVAVCNYQWMVMVPLPEAITGLQRL